jgi:hypothetical protein
LALAWLIQAMRGGSQLAPPFFHKARAELTPEQIAEAERLVRDVPGADAAP